MTRPSPVGPSGAAAPERTGSEAFLTAIAEASAVLGLQRATLSGSGRSIATTQAVREMQPLLENLQACSEDQRLRMLTNSLAEIHERQRQIATLLESREDFEAIALDAYSNAMHRIRTCLDVALGCTDEIGEICGDAAENSEIAMAAYQAGRAMRRVYQYSLELSDMGSLKDQLKEKAQGPVSGNLAMAEAAAGLARMAADASVILQLEHGPGPLDVQINSALLVRVLRYLTLMAIVSPGVTKVTCEVRRSPDGRTPAVEFRIIDNGKGLSLERRADMTGAGKTENVRGPADAAGFAIARRLASSLKGHLALEVIPERGSCVSLVIPMG